MKGKTRGSVRAGLTRDRVVAEAAGIVLYEGAEALSMRDLATRLGVSPMALYNHVGGKDDLVRAVVTRAFGDLELPRAADWREQLRLAFRSVRDICVAYPALSRLIETYDLREPKLFELMELTLAALARVGLEGKPALRAYFLLVGFTMGHVSYRVGGAFNAVDLPRAASEGRLDATVFPLSLGAIAALAEWDYDEAFDVGMDTIIAGLGSRKH